MKQAKLPGTGKQCCQVASLYLAQSGSQPCVLLAENCKAVMSSEKVYNLETEALISNWMTSSYSVLSEPQCLPIYNVNTDFCF